VVGVRYVHFFDSLVWLRYCLTEFLRRRRPSSDYEAAIMLAVAQERPVPSWRTRVRSAIARSRFISALDTAGALVWPKSFTFVARRVVTEGRRLTVEPERGNLSGMDASREA